MNNFDLKKYLAEGRLTEINKFSDFDGIRFEDIDNSIELGNGYIAPLSFKDFEVDPSSEEEVVSFIKDSIAQTFEFKLYDIYKEFEKSRWKSYKDFLDSDTEELTDDEYYKLEDLYNEMGDLDEEDLVYYNPTSLEFSIQNPLDKENKYGLIPPNSFRGAVFPSYI